MESINSVVKEILSDLGYENLYHSGVLIKNWKRVVGEQVASVCTPFRIEKETLFIKCKNPSWKQELYFLKDRILRNVNKFFDKDGFIKDVKIFMD